VESSYLLWLLQLCSSLLTYRREGPWVGSIKITECWRRLILKRKWGHCCNRDKVVNELILQYLDGLNFIVINLFWRRMYYRYLVQEISWDYVSFWALYNWNLLSLKWVLRSWRERAKWILTFIFFSVHENYPIQFTAWACIDIFCLNVLCNVHIYIPSRATSRLVMSLYQSVSKPDLWCLLLKIFSTPNVTVLSGASCMLVVHQYHKYLISHDIPWYLHVISCDIQAISWYPVNNTASS